MRLIFLYLFSFLSTKFWGLDRSLQLFQRLGLLLNRFHHPSCDLETIRKDLALALHRIPLAVKCLDQAIVAWYVLNRNQHPAFLKIGISITPIESHAWVECDKQIFVDTYNRVDLNVVAEYGPWTKSS